MLARPSTSSGPSSSKSAGMRPNFNNRISKDDLALTGRVGVGRGRDRQPYVSGVKGPGLYPPEPSSHRMRMPSPSPISSPAAKLLTPQPPASGEIQIGMALGSPSRDSTFAGSPHPGGQYAGWMPQSQTSVHISRSPPPVQAPEPQLQRTKTQRRRLFGSLFGGKKHSEPAKTSEAADANRSTPPLAANSNPGPARSNTAVSRKLPKHKPIKIRSDTDPGFGFTPYDSSWPSISEPVPSVATNGPGLLNVEIPDIRLERYSVMFSGVLNPNGTKATLLERRQATLEKLKTISDRIENEEGKDRPRQRRATSPQPTKSSPAFTLFPQTPSRQSGMIAATGGAGMSSTASLAPPRGLTRSNTSPAYLPSPLRATFESEQHASEHTVRKERKTVTIVSPRTMDERNRAAKVEKLREQQQAQRSQSQTTTAASTTTFRFGPDESGLILDSPQSASSPSSFFSSDSDHESDHGSPPTYHSVDHTLKPTFAEPRWEIMTPPSSTSTSASSTLAGFTTTTKRSASISTSSTTTTRPSIDLDRDLDGEPSATAATPRISVDEADARLKAAVEISIARQISISRQQRMLLRPFAAAAGGGGAGGQGGHSIASNTMSSTSSKFTSRDGAGSGNVRGVVPRPLRKPLLVKAKGS